ncbi:hypothetical protein [Borreliella valaisiana]|uniref:Uncharacterized protein n=1 Tax=Borreliella valaisiana VS116 TaxID=445987 RepID=D6RX02_BORVA|nr:hypothetical protein [Borreliella valaisiana]AIJ29528.1 hypothetical protein P613_00780 [Borreliella valaisiana Tom4006]EEF81453.1 conserved hypothetical protein [Borreliella valaisiana VS116]WKC76814.1 hypothetical protein QIA32_01305 [Borreliella valaisiana]WLN24976.1 hypothetical protein KJD10_00760 [Borreliella valaisiana]WVN13902.1 hypothetical protein KJD09_00780 [Borreliella valaisiana]
MMQIYFMSVLLNILGGIILAFPILIEKIKFLKIFEDFVNLINDNKKVKNIFGLLFLITSTLEIIKPYKLPIIGNLIPAISLFLIGFILFLKQKLPTEVQNNNKYGKFQSILENNQQLIGIISIIIGIIHFLAAEIPLL